MKKRLLLIDGHNLLFQMFFGMPSPIPDKNGRDIKGVVGFVGAINRLLDLFAPTHVAVLFDSESHNPRRDLLDEYKSNRPNFSDLPDAQNPFTILEDVYRALDILGIKHTEIVNDEVDDVIATYALSKDAELEIYVSSFDSDYFQLISDTVKIVRYRGKCTLICDEKYIKEKLGIPPSLYADHKALVGDGSDNVKGIKGIGPKTATALINSFGGLDGIYSNLNSVQSGRIRSMLEVGKDIAYRNLALIKLDDHAPIPFAADEVGAPTKRFRTMEVVSML